MPAIGSRPAPSPAKRGLTGHALSGPASVPDGGFGRVTDASGERERYLDHLLRSLTGSAAGRPAGRAARGG